MNRRKPLVVLFVGVPGSGKTTFARQLAEQLDAVTINSDAMRLAIWGSREAVRASRSTIESRNQNNKMTFGAMDYVARQVLSSGHSVIYDANNNKRHDRLVYTRLAAAHGALAVVVRLRTPHDVALRRMQDRDETDDQLKFDMHRAAGTLNRFVRAIEEPGSDEFVIEISGEVPFEQQYQTFIQAVGEY